MKFTISIDFVVDESNEQLIQALKSEIERTGGTLESKLATFPSAFYETLVEQMEGEDEEFPGLKTTVRMGE